jgi:hypothetical protein
MLQARSNCRDDDHANSGYRIGMPMYRGSSFRDHDDSPEGSHHLEADIHNLGSCHAINPKIVRVAPAR